MVMNILITTKGLNPTDNLSVCNLPTVKSNSSSNVKSYLSVTYQQLNPTVPTIPTDNPTHKNLNLMLYGNRLGKKVFIEDRGNPVLYLINKKEVQNDRS